MIGIWNFGGLLEAGMNCVLKSCLEEYGMDVCALYAIRQRKEPTMVELNEYILINSGHTKNIVGTGFIWKKQLKQTSPCKEMVVIHFTQAY